MRRRAWPLGAVKKAIAWHPKGRTLSIGGTGIPPLSPGGRGQGEGGTFCILFEIADRNVKGLGAYTFREFCRELESYELINTMDDSGLEGLRRAKLAYHPLRLIESYIVSPA